MSSSCAPVHYMAPRSRFVKPRVEASRQVIGFDLSPKGGKLGACTEDFDLVHKNLDNDVTRVNQSVEEHPNSFNPCFLSFKSASLSTHKSTTPTATSPRSALQQLLSPPLPQSEPATSFPAANPSLTTQPPACELPHASSSTTAKQSSTIGVPTSSIQHQPVPAANEKKWIKGIAGLAGQSQCAYNDERNGAVSAIKYVSEHGEKSSWTKAPMNELLWINKSQTNSKESSWKSKELHELTPACRVKSKKSSGMEEVMMMNIEHPYSQLEKSSNVEISWKEASINIPEKRKKSSLFVLAASSPAAEYTTHLHGANRHSSHNIDMNFLNSCHLCKRHLGQGQEVFMYSGDKAFCSMECRYQQIVKDERKERHAPPVIRSGTSPVYQSYITTSVAATATATAATTTHLPIMINRPNFMNSAAAA